MEKLLILVMIKDIILKEAPTYKTSKDEPLIDLLVNSGLASSKREAREFVQNKAITLDNVVLEKDDIKTNDLPLKELSILRRGKKKLCVLL